MAINSSRDTLNAKLETRIFCGIMNNLSDEERSEGLIKHGSVQREEENLKLADLLVEHKSSI